MAEKRRVKVLGIAASPRSYGNSTKLLMVALEASKSLGAETRLLNLYDYKINPCMACYSDNPYECMFPKECPLNLEGDGYHVVARAILESDAVIFATPVYWFNVAGHLKNLIDRMTSLENMVYHIGRSLVEGKVAGAIAAGEEAGAAMALAWLTFTLNMMGFHIPAWGTAYYHGKGDALDDTNAVMDAYNVGRSVTLMAQRLEPSKWYVKPSPDTLDEIRERIREEARSLRERAKRERPWL